MRLLVYEFVTGGGWYSLAPEPPAGSLLAEGLAMLLASAADFARVPGCRVEVLRDWRLPAFDVPGEIAQTVVGNQADELAALERLAAVCDWTIVIAPEIGGMLSDRCRRVVQHGRLLEPAMETIELASDKHRTAEHLAVAGVRTPRGVAVEPGECLPRAFTYPSVLKPRDGAGSHSVRLLREFDPSIVVHEPSRLEQYCPGLAASVSFLCGPQQQLALAPCRQRLSDDGRFSYLGGELLNAELADRAQQIAASAVAALPGVLGYLGVDLVLGDDPTGRQDTVIEINPRLTTSYTGLRASSNINLAAAMLSIASGERVSIDFTPGVKWDAAGNVRR